MGFFFFVGYHVCSINGENELMNDIDLDGLFANIWWWEFLEYFINLSLMQTIY